MKPIEEDYETATDIISPIIFEETDSAVRHELINKHFKTNFFSYWKEIERVIASQKPPSPMTTWNAFVIKDPLFERVHFHYRSRKDIPRPNHPDRYKAYNILGEQFGTFFGYLRFVSWTYYGGLFNRHVHDEDHRSTARYGVFAHFSYTLERLELDPSPIRKLIDHYQNQVKRHMEEMNEQYRLGDMTYIIEDTIDTLEEGRKMF